MLFDLRGRKHTVVRVVYGGLAAVFAIGFVAFGVGSDVGAGLFGGSHSGGGHGGGGGRSLEEQLDDARDLTRQRPRDAGVWRRFSLFAASAAVDTGRGHGGARLADDGALRLRESIVAYERYTELVGPRRVGRALAQTAARSYSLLRKRHDAVAAQRLAVAGRRDAQGHLLLAQYAVQAGDLELTERSMRRAIALAPRSQRAALRAQTRALRRLAVLGPQ